MDVYNCFVQGYLAEEVYMVVPQRFGNQGEYGKTNLVCILLKSLYDLKQASRQWNIKLSDALIIGAYRQSLHDYSLFTKRRGKEIFIILVYVNELLITGNSNSLIT